MQRPIRLLLVCARSMVWDLLREALDQDQRFQVLVHATSVEEVTSALGAQKVDVALVDGGLGDAGEQVAGALGRIRQADPTIRPIVLLDKSDSAQIVEWFRNGARGVFPNAGSDFKLLCKCVDCVYRGQIWASSEELGWLIEALESAALSPPALRMVDAKGVSILSKREEDVVRLVAEGYSNREMAQALKLSEHTIKNYMFRIFDKVGVSSRTELLLFALNSMTPETTPVASSTQTDLASQLTGGAVSEIDSKPSAV